MDWKDEQEAMRRQDEERSIERWRRFPELWRVTPRDGRKVQPPDRSKFWGGDVHPLQKGVPW